MKFFKTLCLLLILTLALSLSGCKKNTIDDKVIVVGANPNPHAKILEQARPYIESKGYTLKIKIYDDFVLPNIALKDGELDANYFQHQPYLDEFNKKNNTDLVGVYKVHYEPLGIYAGKSNDLTNIKNGAKIAIPNDKTNRARALILLSEAGIIEVDETKGINIETSDITKNPYNVEIFQFEAASIPAQLLEVDFAVINGNYAEGAKVSKEKLLRQEDALNVAVKMYGNVIACRNEDKDSEAIKILVEALSQPNIKEYISNNYNGTVCPF